MTEWTKADIPPQAGKIAIVTGSNSGTGYETALELARAGARVVVAARNEIKAQGAVAKIRAQAPGADVRFSSLDLSSLASVAEFAERMSKDFGSLDLLINNAGVMTPPKREETKDGFELQFGTNHLGHFALTAHLLPMLRRAAQPRVVNVSSAAHRLGGAIHFEDLQWRSSYRPWGAYAQSKLANMLFMLELQRRSDANGWGLMSNGAHPGYARTELIANGPGTSDLRVRLGMPLQPYMSHDAAGGALPTLFAATSPDARRAGYYGPSKLFEMKGPPAAAKISRQAQDPDLARRLWAISEQLTGASFGDQLSAAA